MSAHPTDHIVADALHVLADLVAAGKWNAHHFEADPRQAEDIEAAMVRVHHYLTEDMFVGTILDWRVLVKPVPSTVLADAFDQEAG